METKEIIQSAKHRVLSICVLVLLFTGVPTLLNFAFDEYKLFRLAHLSLDNVVQVNEFTAFIDEKTPQQISVIWDRCVSEYIIVDKNFELLKMEDGGHYSIAGKTTNELIDFNEGCVKLEFTIPEEEWLFKEEIDPGGDYKLIFQMNLTFDNGVSRSHMVTTDEFTP